MAQARTLKDKELKQLLSHITLYRHASRNRAILACTHFGGMRVGEVAALRYCDVLAADGSILAEIRLSADQTKGDRARVVYVSEKLRKELSHYVSAYPKTDLTRPLFYTQKRDGFDSNTLTQTLFYIYRRAGLVGASSHSGRRTFITNLANKGVGVRLLQALAGHRNIGTTQAYIEVNDGLLHAAADLV